MYIYIYTYIIYIYVCVCDARCTLSHYSQAKSLVSTSLPFLYANRIVNTHIKQLFDLCLSCFIKHLSFLVSACLEVRQQNCNLHSFNFSANGTEVSDESGIALASILSNSALQKFSFEACKTEISDSTGTAIAGSLCSNSSLRSFSFVANSCNISDETCQAMAESMGSTCLTSVDFVALHVFVSEKTIMCLQNALHRNRGLQFVRFETSQDGSACVTVREVLGKAMQKDQVRCEHKQNLGSAYPSYPCFQVPSLAQCLGRAKQPCRNAKGICSIGALRVSQRRQSTVRE